MRRHKSASPSSDIAPLKGPAKRCTTDNAARITTSTSAQTSLTLPQTLVVALEQLRETSHSTHIAKPMLQERRTKRRRTLDNSPLSANADHSTAAHSPAESSESHCPNPLRTHIHRENQRPAYLPMHTAHTLPHKLQQPSLASSNRRASTGQAAVSTDKTLSLPRDQETAPS